MDEEIRQWWQARTEDQQKVLRSAAANDRMEPDVVSLLVNTRCPIGPVGTRWEPEPEFGWSWSSRVQDIILDRS